MSVVTHRLDGSGGAPASRTPAGWIRLGARLGYLTKGAVYVLIALLAARAAWIGESASGYRGAMWAVVDRPVGTALLAAVAVGLAAYAAWRVVQAAYDTEGCGKSLKGLATRAGYLLSGLAYAGLVVAALRILVGVARRRRHADDAYVRGWTEVLMQQPYGRWLVAAAGTGVVVFGLAQLRKTWTGALRDEGDLSDMSRRRYRRALWFGRIGAGARGLVFLLIGGWLVVAGWTADPAAARGLGGALDTLAQHTYGTWLLGIAALGLLAYGLYQFTLAGYDPSLKRSRPYSM